jgi:23S rRNA G2069 N7-methylase RlmK/C1962 C5-methylase RlmI
VTREADGYGHKTVLSLESAGKEDPLLVAQHQLVQILLFYDKLSDAATRGRLRGREGIQNKVRVPNWREAGAQTHRN